LRNVIFLCIWFTFSNYSTADPLTLSNKTKISGIHYWHKQLSNFIGIHADNIKLAQGYMALDNTSFQLWNIYNAMSNNKESIYYNPIQLNNFSSAYGMVLYNLPVQATSDKNCKINAAILKFDSAKKQYAWNKTIDELTSQLNQSKPMSLNVSAEIPNHDNDNASTNYIVTINANYQHFLTYYAQPYSQDKPQLMNYSPWYSSCALFKAVRDVSSPHWSSTFGSNGYMQNITVALIIVEDGLMCIKISKNNQHSESCSSSKEASIIGVVISPIADFVAQQAQQE